MDDLVSNARARGLQTALLEAEQWPAPAAADPGLSEAAAGEPLAALDQLRRKGLAPELVAQFWTLFEKRPVELGLFAWDVLNSSLLVASDEVTIRRVRAAARVVREVLPKSGGAWADTRTASAGGLVRRVAYPAHLDLTPEVRRETTKFNALGALETNQIMSREHGKAVNTPLLESAHQFARYLQLAHLSTLATFYLDYLVRRCEYFQALPDWVEAMADAGGEVEIDRDKLLARAGDEELELANYALGRALIRRDVPETLVKQLRDGPTPLDYSDASGRAAALKHARSTLMVAHGFLAEDETPVPFDLINEIVTQNPAWRYAGRVRLALLAHVTSKSADLPLKVLDQFLATFGNDYPTWRDFDTYSEPGSVWLDGMYARSVREATALPHDRAAWEALGVNLDYDQQKEWAEVVRRRIAEQCKLD